MSILQITLVIIPLASSRVCSLHCLSLNLQLLITPLASSSIWPLHVLPFELPTSDYPFGIFQSLTIALYVLRFTDFWLPPWHLQTFGHYIFCPSIYRLLITPLVSSNPWPLHCMFFDLLLLITYLLSSNIWSLSCLAFVLRLLNTPFVSSNFWPFHCLLRFTASDYPFGIFKLGHCIVCHSIYGFCLPFWYLQTFRTIYCDWLYCWPLLFDVY